MGKSNDTWHELQALTLDCPDDVTQSEALQAKAGEIASALDLPHRTSRSDHSQITSYIRFSLTEAGWVLRNPQAARYVSMRIPRRAIDQSLSAVGKAATALEKTAGPYPAQGSSCFGGRWKPRVRPSWVARPGAIMPGHWAKPARFKRSMSCARLTKRAAGLSRRATSNAPSPARCPIGVF